MRDRATLGQRATWRNWTKVLGATQYDQGPIARRAAPPNNRQRLKKLVFFGAGTLALAVALLVLLAPSLVDTPAVRGEIQRRLADALHGQVTWQALEIAVFPSPRAELSELRIEIPGKLGSAKGKLLLPAGRLVAQLDALDLAQALDIARRKAPNLDAIESAEGRVSAKAHVEAGPPWHLQIQVEKSDASVKLAALSSRSTPRSPVRALKSTWLNRSMVPSSMRSVMSGAKSCSARAAGSIAAR